MQIDQLDHQNSCTKVRYELFLHESWSSLFMLHHLPEDLNRQGLSEIARVLKPGGRLLVLDLKDPTGQRKSGIAHQPALMKAAGFSQVETGRQDS